MPWVRATVTNSCNPLIDVGVFGAITCATMGFGATGFGMVGIPTGAVIRLVSARVAVISSTTGATGASLSTGATNRSDLGAG